MNLYHIHTSYVLEIVFFVDSFFRILGYARIRFGYVSAAQKWDIQKKQPARYTNCFLRPSPRSSTPMVVLLRGAGLKKQLMVSTRDPLRGGCAHARTPRKGANLFSPLLSLFFLLSSLSSLLLLFFSSCAWAAVGAAGCTLKLQTLIDLFGRLHFWDRCTWCSPRAHGFM